MVAWLAWSWAAGLSIDEVPNPRTRGGWVADTADILDDTEQAELDAYLQRIHDETGGEVAVVTVRDTLDEPKAFATGLFHHWRIGSAEAHNGLLVLLVLDRRRLEMETGYGLEPVLPDGWLGSMQAADMVPHFKNGDYATGLVNGVHAAGDRMSSRANEVREGAKGLPPPMPAVEESWTISGSAVALGAAGTTGLGYFGFIVWRRRKERTCPDCDVLMEMVPDHLDDDELTEGQQMEEALGSVDYQIHHCTQCGFGKTITVERFFSGYGRCPKCAHKTLSSRTEVVRAATYSSGGLNRISQDCAHCGMHSSHSYSTPRLQKSTSSSSSGGGWSSGGGGGGGYSGGGGGSFGGGSSGGGGAGSSW